MISINDNGQPQFALDQLQMIKEVRSLFNKYRTGSIEYTILFYWYASPFVFLSDMKMRDNMVIGELASGDYVTDFELIKNSRGNFWEKQEVIAAAEAINRIFKVPKFEKVQFYRERVDKNKEILNEAEKSLSIKKGKKSRSEGEDVLDQSSKDEVKQEDYKKFAETQKLLVSQIEQFQNDQEKAQAAISEMYGQTTECSLLHFITVENEN